MAKLSITSEICLFFLHAGLVFVPDDLYNNYRSCLKVRLLSDVENGDGCLLCEAGTEILYTVSVLRLLTVSLHLHCYFRQHFILCVALLNSSRSNI